MKLSVRGDGSVSSWVKIFIGNLIMVVYLTNEDTGRFIIKKQKNISSLFYAWRIIPAMG
jgi:hypothetical protein